MMVDNMKNEEKDIDEEAQEEGDDVEEANVDENSASEAEEGKDLVGSSDSQQTLSLKINTIK
jgi:hypothetical protein